MTPTLLLIMGFGAGNSSLVSKVRDGSGPKTKADTEDTFDAEQRIRLQLDAVASEALSGTVYFEIGTQKWGQAATGGALGADGTNMSQPLGQSPQTKELD